MNTITDLSPHGLDIFSVKIKHYDVFKNIYFTNTTLTTGSYTTSPHIVTMHLNDKQMSLRSYRWSKVLW